MAQCEATTEQGTQCKRNAQKGSLVCPLHALRTEKRCKALTKKDGSRCKCATLPDSEYCWWHDPELKEQQKAARVKGGRSSQKLTGIRKRQFVDLLYEGNSISSVCEAMGIVVTTYWNGKQRDAKFATQCEKAMNFRAELVEDALFYSALAGAVPAQRFFLTNRAPKRWRTETYLQAEVSGPGGGPIPITEILVRKPGKDGDDEPDDADGDGKGDGHGQASALEA